MIVRLPAFRFRSSSITLRIQDVDSNQSLRCPPRKTLSSKNENDGGGVNKCDGEKKKWAKREPREERFKRESSRYGQVVF